MCEEFTTDSDDFIICPYCKAKIKHEPEYMYDENFTEGECDECGKTFDVSTMVQWSWTSSQNCELNEGKHDWQHKSDTNKHIGKISEHTGDIYCLCSRCEMTRYIPVEKKQ